MTLSDADAVDLLTRMLEIESLCGGEDRLATFLAGAMERAGFEVCRDSVGNVIGTIEPARHAANPSEAREIVILGHMDTVPGRIAVERRGGAIYGRGAVDAKGPLATGIVAGARAAQRAQARITVIGAVQEEGPSVGARQIAQRPAPDFLVIAEPGGADAVVLGYKGILRFAVELSQPCSHSAGSEATVCERAVTFWNELVARCAAQSDAASGSGEFDRITPSLLSMSSSSNGLFDTVCVQIGIRLPLGAELEALKAGLRALLPDAAFHFGTSDPAVRGVKTTPLVAAFLRSIRSEGLKPRFKVKTGTSDMNVVGPVWNCPLLAYGPGDSTLDHTPHEHVPIEEYLRGVRVLTRVLEDI